jgi:adhesin/invasin
MLQRIGIAALLLCALCAAQDYSFPIDLPPGVAGQPYTYFDFYGDPGTYQTEGITITTTSAGNIPPGMQVAPFFRYFGTPTTPGTYRFDIILTASIPGFSVRVIYNCTHVIQGPTGPSFALDPSGQTISVAVNSGPQTRSLVLSNRSAQGRTFTATATTNSSRNWLSVDASGSVGPFSTTSLSISADPRGLPQGTYSGTVAVVVSPPGERLTATVLLTVTGSQQNLVLSQSGITFQTLQGGVSPPPQSFLVFNESAGSLSWTATPSTISGGNWLTITPASGTSTGTQGREVQLRVNPSGLSAGDYYGQVEVRATGAANSPQVVGVVMNIGQPGQLQGNVVTPTGLVFVANQGGANPAAQTVTLSSLSNTTLPYTATTTTDGSQTNRFTASPASGFFGGTQPAQISVTANAAGLSAGAYFGEMQLRLPDGTVRRVGLLLVVRPAVPTAGTEISKSAAPDGEVRRADGCTPRRLLPVFTLLGNSFRVAAGWPVPVETRIVDDCGDPMTRGSVVATFSNDDAPVTLVPLLDGRWSWTWTPRNVPAQGGAVTVTVNAQTTEPTLLGTAQAGGTTQSNVGVPVVAPGGILNAASFEKLTPLAPGSLVSVFGSSLSDATTSADRLPLATDLAGTRVILGGQTLPLVFTSSGQVNAMLPADLPQNATLQLVVRRGARTSAPEAVTVAPAQPGVFLAGERAIVVGVRADGSRYTPSASTPSVAGDVLVIYCTGLGATNPPVPAGQAVPSDVLHSTVNTVTVTIGGREAQVLFAGLTPGFTGLYQVNAVVPGGVTAGDAPLVVTVANQSSRPAPVTVR